MTREGLRVSYTLRASRQLREHIAWYEARRVGLGSQLRSRVENAERLALSNPAGFRTVASTTDIRVIVVRQFPFRIFYALRGNTVIVLSVAHTARKPDRL